MAATLAATDLAAQRTLSLSVPLGDSSVARGRIVGREYVDYRVHSGVDQELTVALAPGHSQNYFMVMAPGADTAMFNGSAAGSRFSTITPVAGLFTIRVYIMPAAARRGAAAAYALSVRRGDPEAARAIAAADSLLSALSRADNAGIARFTVDSAILGSSAIREGAERVRVHSWAEDLARTDPRRLTERGYAATARVQDRLAQVWMPYDIYIDGKWSHCGIDAFTLLKVAGQWKTVALLYTVEQPPACSKHPAGPPSP